MGTAKNSDRASWFLAWGLASSIAAGAGVFSWVAVGSVLEAAGGGSQSVFIALAAGAAFGGVFGFGQWLVLRRSLQHAGRWVVASLVGYAFDFLLGTSLLAPGTGVNQAAGQQVLLGAFLGFGVSFLPASLQWLLVLKGQFPGAAWWIPASLAAWGLGFAISFALRLLFGELTFVAGPVVAIALTGLALRRLLRQGRAAS